MPAEIKEKKKHKELKEIFAITDINPEYFTETAGGLVKEKFSLCQYIDDLRQILRSKLLAGEQRDLCILIEQQFDEERRRLSKIKVKQKLQQKKKHYKIEITKEKKNYITIFIH